MANTRPTPIGFRKAAWLVWLLLAKPKRFLELHPEKDENAFVVRRAFFKSLLLVLASGAVGYIAGIVLGRASGCASANLVSWLQIAGAGFLLWGTLFIRGWEIQTYSGVTLPERVNQWIY